MRILLALLLLALPTAARGHAADLLAVFVSPLPDGALEQRIRLTADTLLRLAPLERDGEGRLTDGALEAGRAALEAGVWDELPLLAGGTACRREATRARVHERFVELGARFTCGPGPRVQHFRVLSVLPAGHHVVVEVREEGGGLRQLLAGDGIQTVVLDPPSGAPLAGLAFTGWVALGIQHILEGFDHLAFLAGLLLVSRGWRRVLLLVTSFTAAHSLTLAASALGWVAIGDLGSRLVELAIALSIVVIAVQNLRAGEPRHRGWLTFGFGLLHGFGFAGVLTAHGLGESAVGSLAGFNLGVELGQAAVVLVAYPCLRWLRAQTGAARWLVPAGSVALLALGILWSVERAIPEAVSWAAAVG